MRILVTGATGFVGRHLVPAMSARGTTVRAAVRASAAGLPAGVETAVVGDIGPDTDWAPALAGVDAVVHLAAHAHQLDRHAREDEATFMRVNAAGTRRLMAAVATTPGIRRVVLLSSIGAVSGGGPAPITPASTPAPVTPYGRSKLAGEVALREALAGSSVEWCILRPPLIYGPQNPGNLARLGRLIDTGLPLPLGGLVARRSLLYVGTLVEIIARVLEHPAAAGSTLLVDDGAPIGTAELLRLLGRLRGRAARLFPVPDAMLRWAGLAGDLVGRLLGRSVGFDREAVARLTTSLVVDASATWTLLGWRPGISTEAALRRTFQPPVAA